MGCRINEQATTHGDRPVPLFSIISFDRGGELTTDAGRAERFPCVCGSLRLSLSLSSLAEIYKHAGSVERLAAECNYGLSHLQVTPHYPARRPTR